MAVSQLLFVGSVNLNNGLSSFSNTPGTSNFITTDGRVIPLRSLWIMAPGEAVMGAQHTNNSGYILGTGTSFAAPQVSGAVALLESRWPILQRNATAAQLLLSTATDLGAAGIDPVFGAGLMNVERAFRPVGTLTAPRVNGNNTTISQTGRALVTSGAFGSLKALRGKLSTSSVFDSYGRDFEMDTANLIQVRQSPTTPAATTSAAPVTATKVKFADGGSMNFMQEQDEAPHEFHHSRDYNDDTQKNFAVSFQDEAGTVNAVGYGFSASPSFAAALWGDETKSLNDIQALGFSNDLLSLAQGGGFFAYGEALDANTRYALSYSQSTTNNEISPSQEEAGATAISFGIKNKLSDNVEASLTANVLNEENQWFGADYANSAVNFGDEQQTVSVGLTTAIQLDKDSHIVFDTALAKSKGNKDIQNSLIDSVSETYAHSMGIAYTQKNYIQKDDKISIGIKQPLRIIKGTANLSTSSVDENGIIQTTSESVSLKPDGHEIQLGFDYSLPIDDRDGVLALEMNATKDRDNISGNDDADVRLSAKWSF